MANPNGPTYNISTWSIFKIIIIVLALAFVWLIRDVVGLLFVSIIFASAFNPLVDAWQKWRIPRGLSIVIIYVALFGSLSGIIYLVSGPMVHEVSGLISNFPSYYTETVDAWNRLQLLGGGALESYNLRSTIGSVSLPGATSGIFGFVKGLFGSIFAFFLVLVMTFYMTVEERNLRRFIKSMTPTSYQPYVMQLMSRIQRKLGHWLRGQVMLSVVIFLMTYAGLSALGVHYALVLALLAGSLEVIPYLGPILSAVPAIFLAFQQSPQLALAVVILYFVIQQLENGVIVPKVMGKVVGLNPVVILVAMLIGAKVGGLVGALLAIPVATALSVFLRDFSRSDSSDKN